MIVAFWVRFCADVAGNVSSLAMNSCNISDVGATFVQHHGTSISLCFLIRLKFG
jgi:hypothetical protein